MTWCHTSFPPPQLWSKNTASELVSGFRNMLHKGAKIAKSPDGLWPPPSRPCQPLADSIPSVRVWILLRQAVCTVVGVTMVLSSAQIGRTMLNSPCTDKSIGVEPKLCSSSGHSSLIVPSMSRSSRMQIFVIWALGSLGDTQTLEVVHGV